MSFRTRLVVPLLALTLGLAACANLAHHEDQVQGDRRAQTLDVNEQGGGLADKKSANLAAAPPPAPALRREAAKDEAGGEDGTPGEAPADQLEQKPKPKPAQSATSGMYIIRHATLTLQVPSVKDAQQRITALTARHHGLVSDSHLDASEGGVPTATLTLRVPATDFDDLLGQLGDVGTVRVRTVTGEDVTLEYVDTGSRIRNLQKEEGQLLQLLQRSGKLSDVLQVERELARVRGEIEQAQGRLRHLANQVDLATIEITLSERVEVVNSSPWQLGSTFQNAWTNAQRELAASLSGLIASITEFLVAQLPVLLIALALFALAGWVLCLVLVNALKLLAARTFWRVWAVLGLVGLGSWYPVILGWLGAALLVMAVAWAGMALFGKLFGRRALD